MVGEVICRILIEYTTWVSDLAQKKEQKLIKENKEVRDTIIIISFLKRMIWSQKSNTVSLSKEVISTYKTNLNMVLTKKEVLQLDHNQLTMIK